MIEIQTSDKKLAVLVDPDKWSNVDQMAGLVSAINSSNVNLVLVGGSFMANDLFENTIAFLKRKTSTPVIIFPGNGMQISSKADGILLLSLISGRNPEFLIGQHVVAAPTIARSGISVLPTGYLLIEGGKSTAASYMSNTCPIPEDQVAIITATALAGEQLGMKAIYLDCGSGANNSLSIEIIKTVSNRIKIPLIVGGGIRSIEEAQEKWNAGANVVVIGTAIEKNLTMLENFTKINEDL